MGIVYEFGGHDGDEAAPDADGLIAVLEKAKLDYLPEGSPGFHNIALACHGPVSHLRCSLKGELAWVWEVSERLREFVCVIKRYMCIAAVIRAHVYAVAGVPISPFVAGP